MHAHWWVEGRHTQTCPETDRQTCTETDRQTRLTVICPYTQEVGGEADRHTETDRPKY